MGELYNNLKYEVSRKIAFISLNRPEKRNALNDEVITELSLAFNRASHDEAVKVIVLKAEGKVFCAGADLDYLQKLSKNPYEENLKDSNNLKDLLHLIYSLKKIVIAQINGHAVAGGAGLVMVCDFAFAVPDANFGFTEVNLGFIPALVSVFLLKKIGEGKTRELLLSGDLISAESAKNYGLISHVIPQDTLEEEILKFTEALIKNTSSLSIALTKELLIKNQEHTLSQALDSASEFNAKMRSTKDFQKGVQSFLNKEKPKWD